MIDKNYNLSIAFIIAANLVPIIGVLFFDWSLFQIIFIYWCETGIIGFFSILKILICTRPIFLGVFFSMFFTIHFGGFMFGHLLFISALFGDEVITIKSLWPVFYAVVPLIISHLISFINNFIGKKEWLIENIPMQQNLPPYKRIALMQVVIVFGGLIVSVFNQPILGIALLIVLKIIVDIDAHLKSHGVNGIINISKIQKSSL